MNAASEAIERLKDADFTERQVKAIVTTMSILVENQATKSDIKALIKELRAEMESGFGTIEARFGAMEAKIAQLETRLTMYMVAIAGVLLAAIKFL